MAKTRGNSGITVSRVPFVPTATPQSRQTATKKKSAGATTKKPTTTKANTSKPRAKKAAAAAAGAKDKTATGRVGKTTAAPKPKKAAPAATNTKKAPKTTNKRDPSLLDKVQGVAEKIVGTVQGRPGKKRPTLTATPSVMQAAGTKKIKGTDGKGATRAKKE
ncbi:MAG: hypothetical protein Q9170_001117 [Blastenia crenularia]